jgi:hypothetical protein
MATGQASEKSPDVREGYETCHKCIEIELTRLFLSYRRVGPGESHPEPLTGIRR